MNDLNLPAHYSLYELDNAYKEAIQNLQVTDDGEVIGGEHLPFLKEARDQKIRNYAHMYLILETELEGIDKESKRIAAIKKAHVRKMEWLKQNLEVIVQPGEKFERVTWRKSKAIEVIDVDALPPEYVIQELTPIKSQLALALKRGEAINGCEIVERNHIQIK